MLSPLPAAAAAAKSLQSCPTLCDPIDGSPPGSAVPGILQARTLEWVAISFSNILPFISQSTILWLPHDMKSEPAQNINVMYIDDNNLEITKIRMKQKT